MVFSKSINAPPQMKRMSFVSICKFITEHNLELEEAILTHLLMNGSTGLGFISNRLNGLKKITLEINWSKIPKVYEMHTTTAVHDQTFRSVNSSLTVRQEVY